MKAAGTCWTQHQSIKPDDPPEVKQEKELCNNILIEDKPYFFKYKYEELAKKIREHDLQYEKNCTKLFEPKTLKDLKKQYKEDKDSLTHDELNFISQYQKYYPAIDTNCIMNNICHYIEDVDFHIKQKVRSNTSFDYHILQTPGFIPKNTPIYQDVIDEDDVITTVELPGLYTQLLNELDRTFKQWQEDAKKRKKTKLTKSLSNSDSLDDKFNRDIEYEALRSRLDELCENSSTLANYMVHIFYVTKPSYNKSVMWGTVGAEIYENIKSQTESFYFPIKDENGSLEFCYEKYQIKKLETKAINEAGYKLFNPRNRQVRAIMKYQERADALEEELLELANLPLPPIITEEEKIE